MRAGRENRGERLCADLLVAIVLAMIWGWIVWGSGL